MSRSPRRRGRKKPKKRRRRKVSDLNASNADIHSLYQESVQDPETAIEFVEQVYTSRHEDIPLTVREDFCGTALFCAQWVKGDSERLAAGIDLDEETLEWGRKNNLLPLGKDADRIELICQDVLDADRESKFEVVVAFNFSYMIFKERSQLLDYFIKARDALEEGGVFIIDLYGGPESQCRMEEPTDMGEFDYVWDQDEFNPISHRTVCYIHFRFRDHSRIEKAFTYDWRLWTIPELRDIMVDAGFSDVDVWWDADNGDDDYEVSEDAESMEAFVSYIAAWK